MADLIQIGTPPLQTACTPARPPARTTTILWLQAVTIAWMAIELGVSIYAAATAHSPSMLAFGVDSLVELFSATVIILQFIPGAAISERRASQGAGLLLWILALIVASIAATSLLMHARPDTSCSGIGITIAALIAMPILASLKRREAQRIGNAALAADAVQSATCAYLALIALAGLSINAVFHLPWIDSVAALIAIPVLVREGWSAWQGHACACC
jgi:divalent metal cation (Fe/Co/Zn/Cd) transporter